MSTEEILFLVLSIISIGLFWISFRNDKRKLVNAFLLLFALTFSYLFLISFAYEKYPTLHDFLLGILYLVVPGIILIVGIFFIINGLIVLRKEGKSLGNALSLLLGIVIVGYLIFSYVYMTKLALTSNRILILLMQFLTIFFFLFSFLFLAFFLYSLLYLALPKKKDYDYIIIHGSGLMNGYEVTPLLRSRIDKAIQAFQMSENEDVKMIASGGQGFDESIPEAQAIKNYLLEKGFKEEQILVEDQSVSTYENLRNSKELALQQKTHPKFLFVSNNYHVLRTSFYARQLGMEGDGLGSATAGYYVPSAFIREFIAILKKLKYVILFFIVMFIFLTVVSYS